MGGESGKAPRAERCEGAWHVCGKSMKGERVGEAVESRPGYYA